VCAEALAEEQEGRGNLSGVILPFLQWRDQAVITNEILVPPLKLYRTRSTTHKLIEYEIDNCWLRLG